MHHDQLIITRPTEGPDARRLLQRTTNRHGTAMRTRPIRCLARDGIIWANTWALPFAGETFSAIWCQDVIEHVRDDEALIDELARVLRPGGSLVLRVPASGLLDSLDAHNLYRYLADITCRGARPPETDEIGWRRHYGPDDLLDLLGPDRFEIEATRATGFGAAETVHLTAMVLFRWLRRDDARYRQSRRLAERVAGLERGIPTGPLGTFLTIEATRR